MKSLLSFTLAFVLPFSATTLFPKAHTIPTTSISETSKSISSQSVPEGEKILTAMEVHVHSVTKGYIRGTATNKFTLFPSTVPVHLFLYSSYTYTTDVQEMTLEASAYTPDLNMGDSLYVEQSTNGEQKYWRTYVVWYPQSTQKEILETDTVLFSPDGMPLPC